MNLPKTLFKPRLLLLAASCAGLIVGIGFIGHFIRPAQASAGSAIIITAPLPSTPKLAQPVYGSPVRLRIPAINVDAALDYVNLTSSGALGVPNGPNDAAWYDQGPRPGEDGNAVIDGHSGYKDNIPAVFDDLHKLVPGDDIYVDGDDGTTTTFVVSVVQTYAQDQADLAVFRSTDGKAHLNLITCEGVWSQAQQSYSNRLIVFANKI